MLIGEDFGAVENSYQKCSVTTKVQRDVDCGLYPARPNLEGKWLYGTDSMAAEIMNDQTSCAQYIYGVPFIPNNISDYPAAFGDLPSAQSTSGLRSSAMKTEVQFSEKLQQVNSDFFHTAPDMLDIPSLSAQTFSPTDTSIASDYTSHTEYDWQDQFPLATRIDSLDNMDLENLFIEPWDIREDPLPRHCVGPLNLQLESPQISPSSDDSKAPEGTLPKQLSKNSNSPEVIQPKRVPSPPSCVPADSSLTKQTALPERFKAPQDMQANATRHTPGSTALTLPKHFCHPCCKDFRRLSDLK